MKKRNVRFVLKHQTGKQDLNLFNRTKQNTEHQN